MNRHLASASSGALLNGDTRNQAIANLTCEVNVTLNGGDPEVCNTPVTGDGNGITLGELFVRTFTGFGEFVANGIGSAITAVACGFSEDDSSSRPTCSSSAGDSFPKTIRLARRFASTTRSRCARWIRSRSGMQLTPRAGAS